MQAIKCMVGHTLAAWEPLQVIRGVSKLLPVCIAAPEGLLRREVIGPQKVVVFAHFILQRRSVHHGYQACHRIVSQPIDLRREDHWDHQRCQACR